MMRSIHTMMCLGLAFLVLPLAVYYLQDFLKLEIAICLEKVESADMHGNPEMVQSLPDLDILRRFKHAVTIVQRTKSIQMYEKNVCGKEWELGLRGAGHEEYRSGTTCEPWMSRDAVQVLSHLLTPDMEGLEWSSGSSTLWLILRLKSLVSVENVPSWLAYVESVVNKVPESSRAEWTRKVIQGTLTGDPAFKSNYSNGEANYAKKGRYYEEYARYPTTLGKAFDFISVDGRARPACFRFALKMLKPEGGVLVLDNSDRFDYKAPQAEVPDGWPSFVSRGPNKQDTTIWVSCKASCHVYRTLELPQADRPDS